MAKDDRETDVRQENRQLRQALEECRELLKRTEELLKYADRTGRPTAERN
jgi:hypothetical protein